VGFLVYSDFIHVLFDMDNTVDHWVFPNLDTSTHMIRWRKSRMHPFQFVIPASETTPTVAEVTTWSETIDDCFRDWMYPGWCDYWVISKRSCDLFYMDLISYNLRTYMMITQKIPRCLRWATNDVRKVVKIKDLEDSHRFNEIDDILCTMMSSRPFPAGMYDCLPTIKKYILGTLPTRKFHVKHRVW